MLQIEGTYASAIIFADVIDSGAEGLIKALCSSPLSDGCVIRVMPDVHSGKGCAVGTTIRLSGRIAPGLVGTDIGCGMTAVKLKDKRFEPQKLDKLIREKIPSGSAVRDTAHRLADRDMLFKLRCSLHVRHSRALKSIGTLGGGNHFIELDKGEDGALWIVIHSGSRSLGAEIERYYHDLAFNEKREGVPYELAYLEGADMEEYILDACTAADFASLNRSVIADEIIRGMKFDEIDRFECRHNYIDPDSMILRKGAISAKTGERLIIPMNMRDGCLLCVGKGKDDWNQSAPHGAGRLLSRAEARSSLTLSQFKKEMAGIYSTSVSRDTLDESPMAYKPSSEIIDKLSDTAEIIERLRPVYNFKAGGEN